MLKTVRDLAPALFRRSAAILGANRSSGKSADFVTWGRGYTAAKQRCLDQSLANAELMQRFATFQALPDRFGLGIDERCVEYPWLISRLSHEPEAMLDAGSALNHAFLLDLPQLSSKKLHILTLAPERNCFFQRGIGYLYEDLRHLPLRSELYDCVACISTLEHVGCDNTAYAGDAGHVAEQDPDAFVAAVKELSRVLRPGGSFFLTVPFGKYEHHGSFQQFDAAKLERAVSAFGPSRSSTPSFYRYSPDGWNTAAAADCADCRYVAWVARLGAGGPRPNPLPVEPDRAAAARAVVCLHIVKA